MDLRIIRPDDVPARCKAPHTENVGGSGDEYESENQEGAEGPFRIELLR